VGFKKVATLVLIGREIEKGFSNYGVQAEK